MVHHEPMVPGALEGQAQALPEVPRAREGLTVVELSHSCRQVS